MVLQLKQIISFLQDYVNNLRIDLLFVPASCALAGMAFGPQDQRLLFVLAIIPFFCCYAFGKALSDELAREKFRVTILQINSVGLFLCFALISLLNPWNILFSIAAVLALMGYVQLKRETFFLKKIEHGEKWGGLLYLGPIMIFLPAMGLLAAGGQIFDLVKIQLIWLYTFTLFSFGNLYLMHSISKSKASLKTYLLSDLFVVLSIAAAGMMMNYADSLAFTTFILGSLLAISGQVVVHLKRKDSAFLFEHAFPFALRSFILWHFAVLIGEKSEWFFFCLCVYGLFEISLQLKGSGNEKAISP